MNKHLKFLCGGATLAAFSLFALSACSDEVTNVIDDSGLPLLEQGAIDIASGYNVLIIDINDLPKFRHKLGTRRNVTVTASADCPIKLDIETDQRDTTRYLVAREQTALMEGNNAFDIKLHTNQGDLEKTIKLVVRNVGSSQDVSAYARNIGKGTNLFAEFGNTTYEVLHFASIADHLADNVTNIQKSVHFEIGGTRYDETMEKMSVSVGVDGSSPTINTKHKFFFTGSAHFGQESMTHKINNYEYYLGFYGKVMAEVKLNPDWLVPYQSNGTLYQLLDTTINNILNNPGSANYQTYPNTKDGIFRMFDHYGAQVITKAAFGGNYIWMFTRKENVYEHSIGHDASASAQFKSTNGEAATNWIEVYAKKHSSPYISSQGEGSDYSSDYQTASDEHEMFLVTGGDGNTDIDTWDGKISAMSPENWVIVSFTTLDDMDGRLLPLWDFVIDKDSERYKAMIKYWPEYEDNHYTEIADDELVLADFMMKCDDNGDHDPEDAKSFVGQGPDGKKYIYFPVMANGNFLYADGDGNYVYTNQQGYPAETNQDHFVTGTTNKCHYWYYALAYNSECNGITDILFDNSNHSGYTRRGDHANDGVSGLIDNNYVYVKTGGSSTPVADKIKAVGLYNHSNKDTENGIWRIWGTSGGAEMKMPFENSESINRFNDYWEPQDNDGHTSTVSGSTDFYIGGLGTANDIRLFYQKKSLPIKNLNWGENGRTPIIQHPKKWGE